MSDQTEYTYRRGKKIELVRPSKAYVVRALPHELEHLGVPGAKQMSSASSRVEFDDETPDEDVQRFLEQARATAPTHPAYRVAETGEDFLVTDRILITFHDGTSPAAIDELVGRYGLVLLDRFSDLEVLVQLTDASPGGPNELVVRLTEDESELVEYAENDLNFEARSTAQVVPTDPVFLAQWHLHQLSTSAEVDPRSSSHCFGAWQLLGGYGDPSVVVGFTDDGCRLDHSDFDSPGKFAGWGYFQGTRLVVSTDVDAVASVMYEHGQNHGTSVGGVIAGEVDAQHTVGGAPGCRLLPIKWESEGASLYISDSKLRKALDYLADKVDVLSNSWGVAPTALYSSVVTRRIDELSRTGGRRGKGIVFLWAAGNENCPIEHTGDQDIPYTHGWYVPGGSQPPVWVGPRTSRTFRNNLTELTGVLHVAALGSTARRSHYSNYGPGVDLTAPSSNSHAYYRMAVGGLGVSTVTGDVPWVTSTFGGTSSATPLVAAAAALVLSADPQLEAAEVIAILQRTASRDLDAQGYPPTPPAAFDPDPGSWEVPPVYPADFKDIGHPDGTWSAWFGHGKVDAEAAVAEALSAARSGVTFSATREPHLPIPDATGGGPGVASDVISVDRDGRVGTVRVGVRIRHSWVGDLDVRLISPSGAEVLLHATDVHDGSHDLVLDHLTAETEPELRKLLYGVARGDWTLRVVDELREDSGVLESWSLEIGLAPVPEEFVDSEPVLIPDADPAGITRTLQVPAGATVSVAAVTVEIEHSWVPDLRLTLVPPGHPPITLPLPVGRRDLRHTWSTVLDPQLATIEGSTREGPWTLRVADRLRRDIGTLRQWRIALWP